MPLHHFCISKILTCINDNTRDSTSVRHQHALWVKEYLLMLLLQNPLIFNGQCILCLSIPLSDSSHALFQISVQINEDVWLSDGKQILPQGPHFKVQGVQARIDVAQLELGIPKHLVGKDGPLGNVESIRFLIHGSELGHPGGKKLNLGRKRIHLWVIVRIL